MAQPGDARVQICKERGGIEARERQTGRERIFDIGDRLLEDLEDLVPTLATFPVAFKEQCRYAILDLGRWPVGQREVIGALEVCALGGVALAALVIDESSGWVREGATFRIAHARPPDRVDVQHPAVPEAHQSRIHLAREHG